MTSPLPRMVSYYLRCKGLDQLPGKYRRLEVDRLDPDRASYFLSRSGSGKLRGECKIIFAKAKNWAVF